MAGFASASSLLRLARLGREDGSEEDADGLKKSRLLDAGNCDNKILEAKVSKEKEDPRDPSIRKASVFKVPKALSHEYPEAVQEQTTCAEPDRPIRSELIRKTPATRNLSTKYSEENAEQIKTKQASVTLSNIEASHTGPDRLPPDVGSSEAPASKKPRKKKAKSEEEGQTTIKKAKIMKPGTSKVGDKPKKAAVTTKKPKAIPAETFNTLLGTQEEDAKAREEFRDLCLEKAIPIRRGWTPCKDTIQEPAPSEEITSPPNSMNIADTPTADATGVACFGQLLGDFAFAQSKENAFFRPEVLRQESGESLVKRRKIELVNGRSAPLQMEKQKRTKSPKKKPQTITEKATAPFVPADLSATPSLLQYFNSSTEASASGASADINAHATTTMNPPVTKMSKPKKTTSRVKKPAQPILLSPESAMKNARDQDLVFGTSSQLAREESPTFIKDMQQGMEQPATMLQEFGASNVLAGKFRTSNSLAVVRPRNLWSVSSRDLKGSLLEAEIVDLTETPKPPKTVAPCLNVPPVAEHQPLQECQHQGEINHSLDAAQLNLNATPVLQQQVQETTQTIARSMAEATLRKRPNNRSPVKNATNSKSDPKEMPNYQGFTDAQLAKEVAAYGFKSIKKRVAMITLLEQCWEAKVSIALQDVKANLDPPLPVTTPSRVELTATSGPAKKRGRPPKKTTESSTVVDDAPPKKPRGRPKKDPAATTPPPKRKRKAKSPAKALSKALITAADDDIYDSSPPTPSPPRRSSPNSPGQLKLSQPTKSSVKARGIRTEEDKKRLFAQMTKAITTFPPTNDIKNMTFHEKILMYEPIVLEDLAVWLNTQGLASVGEDDEVEPGLVKEWCEERSVCCLWRENLRGGARARR